MTPLSGRLRPLLPIAFLALGGGRAAAQAGLTSPARVISLAATAQGALSLVVTSGATQSIASLSDNALNPFPTPVVLATNWNLNPGQTATVSVVAWFAVPSQALVNGASGAAIPSSRIEGRVATGAPVTYTAFTQNPVGGIGAAGGSLRLYTIPITGANKQSGRTDNLELRINLMGQPALDPGTYSGTLNIRAVTQ